MISIFFELSKTFAIVFLLNDYFRRHYTNQHKNFCIDMFFYLMYTYSYGEYTYNKIIKYIKQHNPYILNFINELIKTNSKILLDIEFIQNNIIVHSICKNLYLSNNIVESLTKYDFIIYTDTNTIPFNKKIIHNNSINLKDKKNYEYEKCKFKFMMLEFTIGDKNYNIELETQKYNFYIKDNILDKKFFLYYLKYIHPDKINFEDFDIQMDEIILKIIDQNVCVKNIDFTKDNNQCIRLNEIDYEIITIQ